MSQKTDRAIKQGFHPGCLKKLVCENVNLVWHQVWATFASETMEESSPKYGSLLICFAEGICETLVSLAIAFLPQCSEDEVVPGMY